MWCVKFRNQLSAYADGELAPTEERLVKAHLRRCERCASEHARLRQVARLTAALPAEELPNDLHGRILARLACADAVPSAPRPRPLLASFTFWPGAAVAGALSALAIGVVAFAPRDRPVATGERAAPTAPAVTAPPRERTADPAGLPSEPAVRLQALSAPPFAAEEPGTGAARADGALGNVTAAALGTRLPRPLPLARVPRTPPPPAAGLLEGTLIAEPRLAEPMVPLHFGEPAGMAIATMPGDPVVNNVGAPVGAESVMASMAGDKDPSTRMVGMTTNPTDADQPAEEDEALRNLRMFFEERNRTVPQPPAVEPGSRRSRKSL